MVRNIVFMVNGNVKRMICPSFTTIIFVIAQSMMLDATSFISTLIAYYVQPSANNKFHVLHRSANGQLTLVLNNNV